VHRAGTYVQQQYERLRIDVIFCTELKLAALCPPRVRHEDGQALGPSSGAGRVSPDQAL